MSPTSTARDFRIDFFRGLALVMMFIDHTPGNELSNFTLKRLGFSDAAEIFVFLSGVSAALAYGRTFRQAGWLVGTLRVAGRCGRIYVAHLVTLFLMASIAMVMLDELGDPEFVSRLNFEPLFSHTEQVLVAALALRYLPHYLDILPLYILLLALLPFTIGAARRRPILLLSVSLAVYILARDRGWNLSLYEPGAVWYFNPLTWQFLFIVGIVVGSLPPGRRVVLQRRPGIVWASGLFIAFALLMAAPWRVLPGLADLSVLPTGWQLDPGKTDLSPWRLLNVIAQACIAAYFISRDSRLREIWPVRQIGRCGAHALELYCLATVLSLLAFCMFAEMGTSIALQVMVNLLALAIMAVSASLISWYRSKPWLAVPLKPSFSSSP